MHDLVTAETLYDAAGNKLQGTQNTYELKQQTDATVYFPALVSVKQAIYDNNGSGSMSITMHNGTKPSVYDMTYDAYLPYGELLVDEHTSSEEMPYKFNGKELDQKTGLYYYGARYMNPVTILWYGVDALAEKYPSIGGYVYCVGNPIKCVDLDGKAVWLFATKLPGTHVPLATHTFLVVTGDNGKVLRYAAYGPQNGNPIGGDKLTECHYPQDQQVFTDFFKGKLNENLKGHPQKVKIPKGMTSNEFDKK